MLFSTLVKPNKNFKLLSNSTFSSPKGILTPTLVLSAKLSKLIKTNVKTIKIFFMFPPSSM